MCARAEDTVVIRNVYYMMAYAFKALDIAEYRWIQTESFDNLLDLLAAILSSGLAAQRRRGFEKDYETREESSQCVVGRIDIRKTASLKMRRHLEAYCIFDEHTENTYKNQILKTTAWHLIRSSGVSLKRKQSLKKSLLAMQDVDALEPARIEWSSLRYHRNNRSYHLLMNVCYMVLHDLLLRDQNGNTKLATVVDKQVLSRLYEKFILEYYHKHHTKLNASAHEISHDTKGSKPSFLPKMITDVTLTNGQHRLIIDAKCYGTILGEHYGKEILSSANINQILSYVLHGAVEFNGKVSGMLLYAKTKDVPSLREKWNDLDHDFYCITLDLDNEFEQIAKQLDDIAKLIL